MAMGTLDYPFARAHRQAKRSARRTCATAAAPEPDIRGIKVFGELAVHRESLERVLTESPQSLASILLALISALGGQHNSLRAKEIEEGAALVLT
jgi:hypothetical protein